MQGAFTDNTNNTGSEKETNVVIVRYGSLLSKVLESVTGMKKYL